MVNSSSSSNGSTVHPTSVCVTQLKKIDPLVGISIFHNYLLTMHVPSPECARDTFQQSTVSHYRTLIFSKNTFDGRQTATKGVQMTINNLMDKRTVERRKKIKTKSKLYLTVGSVITSPQS